MLGSLWQCQQETQLSAGLCQGPLSIEKVSIEKVTNMAAIDGVKHHGKAQLA